MSGSLGTRIFVTGLMAAVSACSATPPSAQLRPAQPLVQLASLDQSYVGPARSADDVVFDESDAAAKAKALWRAVGAELTAHPVAWNNPATGDHGEAVVLREIAIPETNRVCREYRQTATVAGRESRNLGQVCEQQSGGWSLIEG